MAPTVFEYTNEFHPPGGRLGNVASRFIVGATSEREATNSLARLKALLEQDGGPLTATVTPCIFLHASKKTEHLEVASVG